MAERHDESFWYAASEQPAMPFELAPEALAAGAIAMRCVATTSDQDELSILQEMCCLLNEAHGENTEVTCGEAGWNTGNVSKSASAFTTWTIESEESPPAASSQHGSSKHHPFQARHRKESNHRSSLSERAAHRSLQRAAPAPKNVLRSVPAHVEMDPVEQNVLCALRPGLQHKMIGGNSGWILAKAVIPVQRCCRDLTCKGPAPKHCCTFAATSTMDSSQQPAATILPAESQHFSRLKGTSIYVVNSRTASTALKMPYVMIRSRDCGRHLHAVSAHNGIVGSTTPALKSSGTAAPADHNPLQHPAPVPGTAAASRELAAVRVHEMTSSKGSRSLPHGVLGRLLGGGRSRRPEDVEFNWNGQILHKTNKKHALCFFLC